jgi:hypothetical protein
MLVAYAGGWIDLRAQAEVPSVLRTDTLTDTRVADLST